MSETAWLIEARDPERPNYVLPGHFLGVRGGWQFVWVQKADDALRFARKEDADLFVMAFTMIGDMLPKQRALTGFRNGDPTPIPVEHAWG